MLGYRTEKVHASLHLYPYLLLQGFVQLSLHHVCSLSSSRAIGYSSFCLLTSFLVSFQVSLFCALNLLWMQENLNSQQGSRKPKTTEFRRWLCCEVSRFQDMWHQANWSKLIGFLGSGVTQLSIMGHVHCAPLTIQFLLIQAAIAITKHAFTKNSGQTVKKVFQGMNSRTRFTITVTYVKLTAISTSYIARTWRLNCLC